MDVALSLPAAIAESLVAEAQRYGHRIVAHETTADALAAHLGADAPQLVVAAASPHHLTAALIEECDRRRRADRRRRRLGGRAAARLRARHHRHRRRGEVGSADADRGSAIGSPRPSQRPCAPLAPDPVPVDVPLPATSARTLRRRRWSSSAPRGRGTVIAVWGPGGAPGRTSLAIAIAAELGAAGVYTALGDADTHGASIAPALGLLDEAPGFAAACRLAGAGALTRDEFERIGQFHRASHGGFWVLTGLGRPSRWPELSSDRVAGAIAAARDWVDVLVLDTAAALEQDEELSSDLAAPRRNAATLEALRAADHVVAVAAADPIGLVALPADARRTGRADRRAPGDGRRQQGALERDRAGCGRSGAPDPVAIRRDRGCRARSVGSRRLRRGDSRRADASRMRPRGLRRGSPSVSWWPSGWCRPTRTAVERAG